MRSVVSVTTTTTTSHLGISTIFLQYSQGILKKHKREKHDISKHKLCPYCGFRSHCQQSVNLHIDRKHPEHGEKQFFCDVCGKGFIFKASLKDHPVYYCPKNPRFKGRTKKTEVQP